MLPVSVDDIENFEGELLARRSANGPGRTVAGACGLCPSTDSTPPVACGAGYGSVPVASQDLLGSPPLRDGPDSHQLTVQQFGACGPPCIASDAKLLA
jgi:hypothetical protein